MTKKFYKKGLDTYEIPVLLCASPFTSKSILNFNNSITEKIFFDHIYTEEIKEIAADAKRENETFDTNMKKALKSIDNMNNHVQLIRICGYGGCGKTTYLRHLLWDNKDDYQLENSIINYEEAKTAKAPIIKHIALDIKNDGKPYLRFLNELLRNNKFDLSVFEGYLTNVKKLTRLLFNEANQKGRPDSFQYKNCISKFVNSIGADTDNKHIYQLRFLIMMDFLHLLYHQLYHEVNICSILIDNIDNLDNISEEINLVSAIRLEAYDINAFIDHNLDNHALFLNKRICDHLLNKKLVLFLTTRIVTEARIQEIAPDTEIEFGWSKYVMPHHYYSQRAILTKIIDYYIDVEGINESTDNIKKLKKIRELIPVIYVSNYFKRIFNGNIRYSKNTLCNLLEIYSSYRSFDIISESINLFKLTEDPQVSLAIREGLNGIVLSMVLFYFKREGIYSDKLYLSECEDHETISISRIILTMLREKEKDGLSLYKVFELLDGIDEEKYTLEYICDVIYNLSEAKRSFWRRLLIFETHYPMSVNDLYIQSQQYRNGNKRVADYSRIKICTAGISYLDFVIPHFEFMASRLSNGTEMLVPTSPLFCENSIEIIDKNIEKYRFEKKISEVFDAVTECCKECSMFSKKVIMAKRYTMNDYAVSDFNYRPELPDKSKGTRQSYESRLIFRHVGYIEKYRQYILFTKKSILGEEKIIKINEKLVCFIKEYLNP